VRGGESMDTVAVSDSMGDYIGKVYLSLAVVGSDPMQGVEQEPTVGEVDAGIDFPDRPSARPSRPFPRRCR